MKPLPTVQPDGTALNGSRTSRALQDEVRALAGSATP